MHKNLLQSHIYRMNRENLIFAAQLRLPRSFSLDDRFMRVEQVMKEVCSCDAHTCATLNVANIL